MKVIINLVDEETLNEIVEANAKDDKTFFQDLGQIVCAQVSKMVSVGGPDGFIMDLKAEGE